jgi:hypothetical protein
MQDEITIDLTELTKVYVVCGNEQCRAEVSFDLTQRVLAREVNCPVCGNILLNTNQQERFAFTWPSLVQLALRGGVEERPRMFFRLNRQ